jgi:glycosyltransferase involved in cell wall biosynthesis
MSDSLYDKFQIERKTPEYLEVFTKANPKVSVVLTTYNAGDMLVSHSLKSVLNQTYKNLEIIVIADGCTDNTEELMGKIKDSRIIFENKRQVQYPDACWYGTGVGAINRGLQLCTGGYTSHLDDDDFWVASRIEKLVEFNHTAKADALHHPFNIYNYDKISYEAKSLEFSHNQITTSMLFYHSWFSQIPFEASSTRPGDWGKCLRMLSLGINTARYPEILMLKNETRHPVSGRNLIQPWAETV